MTEEATNEATRAQTLAFNTEAARSGLFAAAIDIADIMRENDVPEGEAALITGAVEFAVQLWDRTMIAAGQTPKASREAFEKQAKFFFKKHRQAPDEPATEQ